MSNQLPTVIAVVGVCVIAAVLIVLGRRRRQAEARPAVEAVVVDEPGKLVLARTHDGTQYQGTLAEPEGSDGGAHASGAYLTLAGPIVFRRVGGDPETMPSAWDRLALPLADVAEVWTRSAPATTAAPAPPPAPAPAASTEDVIARLRDGGDVSDEAPAADDSRSWRRHPRRERRDPVTTP